MSNSVEMCNKAIELLSNIKDGDSQVLSFITRIVKDKLLKETHRSNMEEFCEEAKKQPFVVDAYIQGECSVEIVACNYEAMKDTVDWYCDWEDKNKDKSGFLIETYPQ